MIAIERLIFIEKRSRSDGWRGLKSSNVIYDRGIRDPINPDRPLTWDAIGRRGGLVEELYDRGVIEPRSRRDRAAIAARSSRDRGYLGADLSPIDRPAIDEALTPRSTPDRDSIVARSWRKSWRKRGTSEAKLKLNTSRFVAELKPRLRPKESPPRRQQTAPTNASIAHDPRANFPL